MVQSVSTEILHTWSTYVIDTGSIYLYINTTHNILSNQLTSLLFIHLNALSVYINGSRVICAYYLFRYILLKIASIVIFNQLEDLLAYSWYKLNAIQIPAKRTIHLIYDIINDNIGGRISLSATQKSLVNTLIFNPIMLKCTRLV